MGDGGSGEKTEEPTPERLRKLRQDGNVPKSQDVNMAVSFIVVFCVLAATLGDIADEFKELLQVSLAAAFSEHDIRVLMPRLLLAGMITMGKACAPILGTALVLGVVMNVAQVGFMFTTKPLHPDLNKINPINGLKGMINKKKLVELLKTIIKFVLICYLSWKALQTAMRDVALIVRSDLGAAVKVIGGIIWDFTIEIGGAFLALAAADYFYQKKRYTKDNMMSKHDIKQEYKQSEGDPHHKAERKRTHQEIVNSAGPSNVKKASVVVRNPDHIAVALSYDKEKGTAPTVVAKGQGMWAEKILDAARKYGVPVVRNVPLAQALDKLEVDDEIPEELYEAVAEVLNFIFTLSQDQKKKSGKQLPPKGK